MTDGDRPDDEPSRMTAGPRPEEYAIRLLGSPPLRRGPTTRRRGHDVRAERLATYDRGGRHLIV